ncbi:SGNH/GDSL hydrolase family protein [Tamlana sp. 2_MG-2023]|uniref:SGNH/GDSL hydrolase family protein n=1 Tax=unclassified Tamlana TaxID=2614803 RepID=UPI0026E26E0A|nr:MULTISPECIES: SGNH/GDSL hydrolase family protein [unclassified Tamlana]MDO6759752.1 SGNH/GDSL hydrolase family protein [Tamlana sp. 2_MG-2023]MDO6791375.1 SGNH/GDSL hydrolase family protein [Tamlana sp. 1_MG-2023]
MKKFKFFKITVFLIVVTCLLILVSNLFNPKSPRITAFYEEPENSLDVILLGSSYMANGINPNVLWEHNKITSYNLGAGSQPIWISYFFLKEALKYQTPKVVVLEAYYLHDLKNYKKYDNYALEATNRRSLDQLNFSLNKIQAIKASVPNEEFWDYFFTINKYHDRWKNLVKTDFQFNNELSIYKGFSKVNRTFVDTRIEKHGVKTEIKPKPLHPKSVDYLNKIQALCREHNIQLVLLKTPMSQFLYSQDHVDTMMAIKEIAKKGDIHVIDFNSFYQKIGFDFKKHMSDQGGHLNAEGTELVSKALGDRLEKQFFQEKKTKNSVVEIWNGSFQKYKKSENAKLALSKIKKSKTLPEYFSYAKALDFLVLVSVFDDGSGQYRNYHKPLTEFGLNSDLNKKFRWSYLGVKNNKSGYVKEVVDSVAIDTTFRIGKLDISMLSVGGNKAGSRSSIKINGKEYSKNKRGHNFVIVDIKDETVFDTFNVDTHGDNKLTIKR